MKFASSAPQRNVSLEPPYQRLSKFLLIMRPFYIRNVNDAMLGGSPCHHGMARPRVAEGRDGLQLEVSCEYIE
jgi:hypothetical protein